MSQSLAKLSTHLIFSTKNRAPLIAPDFAPQLYAYLTQVFRTCDSPSILIGGQPDHVHALFLLSKDHALSEVVKKVKQSSSGWIKSKGSQFNSFYWQAGYGAFAIGESGIDKLKRYIGAQATHHRKQTFQDELRVFFQKYHIAYDERYVWD